MGWFLFPYFIPCFFHLLLFHFPSCSSSLMPLCNPEESSALLQFSNSFTINNTRAEHCEGSYPRTASWENGTNCCMWDGVTCDTKSGHVTGLDLSCSWLVGEFHPNSTLFRLTHLQKLNLAFNDFYYSPMLSGLSDLVTLTHLNLSSSGFVGVIPSKISHLSKLVSLDLSSPDDTILEPSTWEKLILNVTGLRELHLGGVNMSFIKPSSLSLLMNLSSSLVSLHLRETGLQGNLENNIFYLPALQNLDLSSNENLKGQLPKSNWSTPLRFLDLSFSAFSGEVPDSIGHLKSLGHLDLSSSGFSGEVPGSIGHLKSLTHLGLSGCNFGGPIPLSFWNLTQLTYLRLRSSNIIGEIPSLLSNFQHLTFLDLSTNNLSGHIPDVFGKLSKLVYLDFSFNNLGGRLPSSMFGLTQLSVLDCGSNELVGPIPDKAVRPSNLRYLYLADNLLNGTIPHWCYSLPSLLFLYLSDNQLTGPIDEFSTYSLLECYLSYNNLQGKIPKSMFDLQNLTSLFLSSNNLSGFLEVHQFSKLQYLSRLDLSDNIFLSLSFDNTVDYSFPNLHSIFLSSCNINVFPNFLASHQTLMSLDLSKNKIHGMIPKWFYEQISLSWKEIQLLDLSFNLLQGDLPIPPLSIVFFSISNNKLIGKISSAICNASSLGILNLSHNMLTGMIPQCLGTFPSLLVLDLQMNNLDGTIPRNFLEGNVLETIKFNGNRLEGSLPQSLAHCKHLKVLDLGENNIKDTFPSWLEPLQELQVLVLRSNKLNGVITHLKTKYAFQNLRIFDVSNNSFSGPLPRTYIKNFKGMMNVNVVSSNVPQYMESHHKFKSYNDSVAVTVKGNEIELERILTTFTIIDFSHNRFEGEIPSAIGELNSLIGLNLSHNRIAGSIPQSLGDLKILEWLDLSSNKLVGHIPSVLTNLNFLSFLNLAHNQLEGMIPSGKQFNTFQNDSFEGNQGLCGLPLSKSCNNDGGQSPDSSAFHHEEHFGFGWKVVAVGYACGVVFGMLLGCIVFSTGKPQWLVRLVEGVPNKRVKKRSNAIHANRRRMN